MKGELFVKKDMGSAEMVALFVYFGVFLDTCVAAEGRKKHVYRVTRWIIIKAGHFLRKSKTFNKKAGHFKNRFFNIYV